MPTLLALGSRSLYIGPAFGLTAHTNAVSLLAFGLDGAFHAAVGESPGRPEFSRTCRSAFIPAHTLLKLDCGTTTMAFFYVDVSGLDHARLQALSTIGERPIAFDLPGEERLIPLLERIAGSAPGASRRALWGELLELLQIDHERHGDARILRGLATLAREPSAAHSLADLAGAACLSESRYLHLFKQTTGVPLRRYRLWMRVGAAVRAIARGSNMTEAALDAGFSSSAHFSFVFREMFGMSPSMLAANGLGHQPPREAA